MKEKMLAIKAILGKDMHEELYKMYQWSLRHYVHRLITLHNSIKKGSKASRSYKCKSLRKTYSERKVNAKVIIDGAKILFSIDPVLKEITPSQSIKIMREFFCPQAANENAPSVWVFSYGPNGKTIQHSYPLGFEEIAGNVDSIDNRYSKLREKLGNTPVLITDKDLRPIWYNNADNIWLQVGDKYGAVNERLINLNTGFAHTCGEEEDLRTMIYKMRVALKKKSI